LSTNGALALAEVCLLADDVAVSSARYTRLLGLEPHGHAGRREFALDGGCLSILNAHGFERRFGVRPSGVAGRFAAAVVRVCDTARCERLLRERGIVAWHSAGLLVTRFAAGGDTLLAFCA
jgi:catechol 2,3-dioxygenase-like lactoylglutathione lyase family enzyme